MATAGREGWSSKGASMSREGCRWVGVERQNLVGARSNLCPRRDCCSQCTWFAVDDHRCTGRVLSQKSHSLSSDPPQGAGRGPGACLPLQPSSPQNKLELQRRFSKSVGGPIQVLAGKHSQRGFRTLQSVAAGRHLRERRRTRVGGGAAVMSRGVGTEYVGGQSELYRCFPGNGTNSSRKNRKQRLGGTFANCCARQIPKAGES